VRGSQRAAIIAVAGAGIRALFIEGGLVPVKHGAIKVPTSTVPRLGAWDRFCSTVGSVASEGSTIGKPGGSSRTLSCDVDRRLLHREDGASLAGLEIFACQCSILRVFHGVL